MNVVLFILIPVLLIGIFVFANLHPGLSTYYGNASDLVSFLTALLTYFYVIFTGRMVKQMVDTAEDESRPFIIVDMEYDDGVINFSLRNIGKTPARNIRAKIEPDINLMNKKTLNNTLFAKPISLMPPGKEIKTFVGMHYELLKEDQPKVFEILVEYEWKKKKAKESYIIDLSVYQNLTYVVRKNIHHVAKSLEELDKKISRVIKWDAIYVKTPEDLRREREERERG